MYFSHKNQLSKYVTLKISDLTTVKKLFKMHAFSLEAQETMSFQAWL